MELTIFKRLRDEVGSIRARDPAARSLVEILLCYPGVHALLFYRLAHWFWKHGFLFLGRFVSQLGRLMTGIEIHPAAEIGRRLFIDHGMGVVIGATAVVGDDVTLYQGVTLGGTSLHEGKRHPTLGDGVIVGSGAQILGPIRIGSGARVGANAVVLNDVPDGVTMVGIPARMAARRGGAESFVAYGTPDGLPDPVARTFEHLRSELNHLRRRVEELEGRSGDTPTEHEVRTVPQRVGCAESGRES